MTREEFIKLSGLAGASVLILNGCDFFVSKNEALATSADGVVIQNPTSGEDIFSYINRVNGGFENTLYRQILGAANEFKEGDKSLNISAANKQSRIHARELLGNTNIGSLNGHSVYKDEILELIQQSTKDNPTLVLSEY